MGPHRPPHFCEHQLGLSGAESAETDIEQFRSFGHSLSTIQMLGMAGQREKVQGRFFVGFRETGDPSDAHVEIRRIDSR